MGLVRGQRDVDEAVVRGAGVILRVIRAQRPVLKQVLRCSCEVPV